MWIGPLCTSIDYDGLSKDLGGHLSSTDIKNVFDIAGKGDILTAFSTVGNLFNQATMKAISGYDAPLYSGKTCPTTMTEAVSLFTPEASPS